MSCIRIFYLSFLCLVPSVVSAQDDAYLPLSDGNLQVRHTSGFILAYSEPHEQAAWVAYELTAQEVTGGVGRTDNFRSDHEIGTGSASLVDYKGSGYDRGHLAPAGDMKWSLTAMDESFFMSNISPQVPGFNRGIWKKLESTVRVWAGEYKKIYIVTGPVLTKRYPSIGKNNVSVPEFFYKVILDYQKPELKAIGFVLPNKKSKNMVQDYSMSVDEVEDITGINFFHSLDDAVEDSLESFYDIGQWSFY